VLSYQQPLQIGESTSPFSNSIQTLAPTLGSALPVSLERPQGTQGIAQPLSLSPMTSGTVARMRPRISGSLTSVTVPRYFP